ncbi:MAG TPA: hypothetical protein DCQ06_06920 [Myxococcales bacterium]|nr:hypothetical protein [Myxococcales bacterium]HAN31316.1 hypothetical protein [Myxococcales bacterium]
MGGSCSNGRTEKAEQCDDGNTNPNDGCDGSCQVEGECTSALLDGSKSHIVVSANALPLAFTGRITMHGWFRLDAYSSGGTCKTPQGDVACSELFSYGAEGSYRVSIHTAGNKLMLSAGNVNYDHVDLGPVSTGQWTHVAVVVTDGHVRAYLNGRVNAQVKLTSWPLPSSAAKKLIIGGRHDAQGGLKAPLKGAVKGFHVRAEPVFFQNFGPQVKWDSERKGNLVALWMNEGVGTKLSDDTNAKQYATLVSGSWASNSGPYCKIQGVMMNDTKALTPGSDAFVVQPGAFAVFAKSGDWKKNNSLITFYAWGDNKAQGGFSLNNVSDEVVLVNTKKAVVDKVAYTEKWPWNAGQSMYLQPTCYDPKSNDAQNCWSKSSDACIYGDGIGFNSLKWDCSSKACLAGNVCVANDAKGTCGNYTKCCVAKDAGTPGAENVCK